MAVVPRWFCVVAHGFAVAFALWLGLHIYAPTEWIGIFAAVAVISALLPYFRVVGFVGLACGLAIAGFGAYLLRDAWTELSFDTLTSPSGGILGGGRDALAFGIACAWLVIGSAFRTRRA
jgi:hypothetical protein